MAAENWSFTPALDSSKITTAETNGKLVITVKPNVFTTDTQYTVKYDDKNGCTASTIFYIKENCSGGGGGDEKGNKIDYTMVFVNHSTTTIEKNSVDDSGVFLFLEPQHLAVVTKEGSLKEKWPSAGLAPNAQTEITVTCKTNTGDPNEYIDKIKSWEYQHDNIDLDTNKAVRFYYPGHNSDTIMALPLRNKKSDGSLAYRTVGDDTNKMYIHLYDKSNQPTDQQKAEWYASQGGSSSVCIIQGKTLNATDSGEKVIGVLPTNGTWSFNPGGISWLGSITQHGTDVKASTVIENTNPDSRSQNITATCVGDTCGDCAGEHVFTVTQNGTSPSPGGDIFKVIPIILQIHNFTDREITVDYISFLLTSPDDNGNCHGKVCITEPGVACYDHCYSFEGVGRNKISINSYTIGANGGKTNLFGISPSWEEPLYKKSNGCDSTRTPEQFEAYYSLGTGTGGLGFREANITHGDRYGIQVYYGANSYLKSAISSTEYQYSQKDLIIPNWTTFKFVEEATYHIYVLDRLEGT